MPEHTFRIVPLTAENAVFVGSVFRSVYGDDFPVQYVYQPQLVIREIEEGRLAANLAFDESGQPAGYLSQFKVAPNFRLWEGGNLIINPLYNQTDLALQLFTHYFNYSINNIKDSDGIYVEAVCHHYFTQIACAKFNMQDCAIELDQLDGSSFKGGRAETERVTCAITFLEMSRPTVQQYLPPQYMEVLEGLAEPLYPRTFLRADSPLPDQGNTLQQDNYHEAARTWKISIHEIGADWVQVVKKLLQQAKARGVISLQIVLNTACPHLGEAVAVLRQHGFFLGGLIPRWFGTDGMLMQQVLGKEPDYDGIKLYTPTAKKLLKYISADRNQVCQCQHNY